MIERGEDQDDHPGLDEALGCDGQVRLGVAAR
jgi:hypothetical protein